MDNMIEPNRRIAMVICAHNEASIIQKTVQLALEAARIEDSLFVVADNCSDSTASVAEEAGAQVYRRDVHCPPGKGAALAWFVRSHWNVLRKFSRVVVLDADTIVRNDFLDQIRSRIAESDCVMQCFVLPSEYENSPISTLIALSELLEQSIFNRIKTYLGWSVRLRGTGMVIAPSILLSVCDDLHTDVEDIALTLLISSKNMKIVQLSNIFVQDPKPHETSAASRQRARWFRGQWAALWYYRSSILRILTQGPGGFELIGGIFLKPRWLMMAIKVLLAIQFIQTPIWGGLFALWFLFDFILILIGISQIENKTIFIKALFYLPGFVLMWLKSILLSFQKIPWLRVRELPSETNLQTFDPQQFMVQKKRNQQESPQV